MDRELLSLQGRAGSALSGGLGARLRACSSPPLPSADGWWSFSYLVVWAVIAARNAWRDFVRLRDTLIGVLATEESNNAAGASS